MATDQMISQFQKMEAELSVYRSCILLESRVMIPSEERKTVLETLHLTHLGVVKMKCARKKLVSEMYDGRRSSRTLKSLSRVMSPDRR